MSKVFVVLAVIATASFASVLKFKDEGGSFCAVKKQGADLQASCDGSAFASILQPDNSHIEGRLSFIEDNIEQIFQHLPCSPGQHRAAANPFAANDDIHTAVCTNCAGNTYTDDFNKKPACTACPTGYAHDDAHDHSYCDVCAIGYGVNKANVASCFFLERGTYQYDAARSKCQETNGADIASIHSAAENTLVRTLQWNSGSAYLGAEETSSGVWTWSDGSAWDYSPPNSVAWGGDCLDNGHCKRLDNWSQDETRIAMSYDYGDQKWEDWGTGYSNLHAICRSNHDVSDCAAMGGVSVPTATFDSKHDFCTGCAINRFSGDNSQGACTGCPANTHTNGEHTQAACTMCDAGYGRTGYDADGHAVCTACVTTESYSTATMITCDAIPTCGVGEGLIGGTTFSTTTAPSNYCTSCDANHLYSDEDSLSSCETHEACPAGEGVVSITDVSDTSHRTCETCSANKYSATNAFAQCYTKSSKYSKTNSVTAPLQCAASHYRSGTIQYSTATGALSNDVCNGCSACLSTPIRTACSATADAACCSVKPAYSHFTANANTLSPASAFQNTANCAFACDDSNASGANCDCNTGHERLAGQSTCSLIPTSSYTHIESLRYCNSFKGVANYPLATALASCSESARVDGRDHFFVHNHPYYTGSGETRCYTCSQSWSNAGANAWNTNPYTETYRRN